MPKKDKKEPMGNAWDAVIAEIEAAMAERDQTKNVEMWAKIDTEKLLEYTGSKLLDMEVLSAKIKLVNAILKGRIVKANATNI